MEYRISLTGDLGSGKSTVSKIISEKYGCEIYSTGKICRAIAASKGINDIKEMNLYMATHPEIDKEIDDGLVALSDKKGNLIVDSRMAWHFTKPTFKVYLSAAIDVAAERIFKDNRSGESYASVEEMKKSNIERKSSENSRYFEMYGVNIYDMTNYDLIVDTTAMSANEAAEIISLGAEGKLDNNGYIYPARLFPTKDIGEFEKQEGTPVICCYNNNFYIISGHKKILEAITEDEPYIICDIVKPTDISLYEDYSSSDYREWFSELHRLGRREFTRY